VMGELSGEGKSMKKNEKRGFATKRPGKKPRLLGSTTIKFPSCFEGGGVGSEEEFQGGGSFFQGEAVYVGRNR